MSPERKVVSADDDTLFRFRRFREDASVSAGDGGADGLPHFLPMAPDGTDRITEEYPGDPLRDFGGVLGTPARVLSPGAPFSGKVRAAMAGVRGGRWYSSPFAVMDVDPALHRLAWKDSGEYAAAKRDPDALLLARAPLLTRNPFFVASFFGWDGSEILPPFFPNIRNSDGIWSFLCRALYPDSPVCHMPFAVEHDRSVHPSFSDADFADFSPPAGIIMLICGFFFRDIEMGNPEAALMALGSRLSGCAALPKREWRRFVTELHLAGEGSKIRRLEARLEAAGGEPGYWAADAARHLEAMKKAALSCEPYLTREFLSFGRDAEEAFRDYVARCGELLAAWPEIWERMR